jgi:toxin-antitoxin system PIN domain toxin
MIVVDANLLIYSYDTDAIDHVKSSAWVAKVFSGTEPVGLPWQTVTAFLRVVTNRRLPGKRVTLQEAIVAVEEWLEQPNVRILAPGENHWPLLKQLIVEGAASGPLVTDAQLAALATEYGGVLYTADQDFARFPGLQWVNPLI